MVPGIYKLSDILRLSEGLTRKIEKTVLAQYGLGPVQFTTLARIGLARVVKRRDLLLKAETPDQSGMTKLLQKLEKGGLIHTAPSPENRRIILVSLTPQGRALWRKAERKMNAAFSKECSALINLTAANLVRLRDTFPAKRFGSGNRAAPANLSSGSSVTRRERV